MTTDFEFPVGVIGNGLGINYGGEEPRYQCNLYNAQNHLMNAAAQRQINTAYNSRVEALLHNSLSWECESNLPKSIKKQLQEEVDKWLKDVL